MRQLTETVRPRIQSAALQTLGHRSRMLHRSVVPVVRRALRACSHTAWQASASRAVSQLAGPRSGRWGQNALAVALGLGTFVGGSFAWAEGHGSPSGDDEDEDEEIIDPGAFRDDLPTYSLSEVALHDGKKLPEKSVWVVFRRGVYDVTSFATEAHPGGAKILLAAGGDISPFWNIYAVHHNQFVYSILEELRIANLDEAGAAELARQAELKAQQAVDPFENEPERHPGFLVRADKPFNAETPADVLADNFITPAELFYVRNHLPVPAVDAAKHTIRVEGPGVKYPLEMTVADLETRFPQHTVVAGMQCGGNRRREMSQVRHVNGLDWDRAAIGNVVWTGPKLRDILLAAGVDRDCRKLEDPTKPKRAPWHVQFEGADRDEQGNPYGGSIEACRALSEEKDVIIATKMNHKPIPVDHGYPVRAVVPGVVGSRSVKWLERIIVHPDESMSFWQRRDYKAFGPATDWSNMDYDSNPSVQEMPVQAAILRPLRTPETAVLKVPESAKTVRVDGYAWSGGGRSIARVDVSPDGGKTWMEARLQDEANQVEGRHWSWVLWHADVPIVKDEAGKDVPPRFVARAVDGAFNVQPERVEPQWSARGLLNNAWSVVAFDGIERTK
jgi:sulfite oxidase